MEMTAEQIAHRKLMDEVNAAFIETPIDPVNPALKAFNENVKHRGLLLDPREVCKLIDAEAKRQYQEIFDLRFKGQHISTLTAAKDEVIKWFNDEEERFAKFKDGYIKNKFAPEEILNDTLAPTPDETIFDRAAEIPMTEVTEKLNVISMKKKKGK